jgi:hypothetical protein
MAERMGRTEPFHGGGNTKEKGQPAQKVPVKFKMSEVRNAGSPDPLAQALVAPPRVFSDTMKFQKKPVRPKGANYNPAGEFGRPTKGRS